MNPDELTGSRVRALRKAQGLSQAELGDKALSASYLSMIESGARQASAAALRHLADRLGTTVEHLARGVEPDCHVESDAGLGLARLALREGRAEECLALLDGADPARHTPGQIVEPTTEHAALRGRALEALGRTAEAAAAYEARLGGLERGSLAWAEAAVDLVRRHLADGDAGSAATLAEPALAVLERRGLVWTEPAVRLAVQLADARVRQGDPAAGHALLTGVEQALCARTGRAARADGLRDEARAAHRDGRFREAHALADRALALYGELDRERAELNLRAFNAVLLAETAPERLADAVAELESVRGQLLHLDAEDDLTRCELALAEHLLRAEDVDGCHRLAGAVLARGTGRAHETRARLTVAEALLAAGEQERASGELAEAVTALEAIATGDRQTVECWRRAAVLHQRLGAVEAAMHAYDQALRTAGHSLPYTPRVRERA